jgi:hypothetical protein
MLQLPNLILGYKEGNIEGTSRSSPKIHDLESILLTLMFLVLIIMMFLKFKQVIIISLMN